MTDGGAAGVRNNNWRSQHQVACVYAGRVQQTIALPVPHVTNLAFGGKDLTDLYITSARAGLSPQALAAAPLSGGLFRVTGAGRGRLPGVWAG